MSAQTHELKVWPEFFPALLDGRKTFELRKDDRGFGVGDKLVLREYAPGEKVYTGRSIQKTVTYVIYGDDERVAGFGLKPGFAILGLSK